jgi:anhydro-N-acetylmuramic acid kinase
MHRSIQSLYKMAQAPHRTIVGLMSGTSLDGLDIAVCKLSGYGMQTQLNLLEHTTYAYSKEVKQAIKTVFAQSNIVLQDLCLLNAQLGSLFAAYTLDALQNWNIPVSTIDVIASHGQTIYHAPKRLHGFYDKPNSTLQIADADHIAQATGIITISDFRQKHIAAGGEGAPLVTYGDAVLFTHPSKNRVLLNMGGIANFTWLPASHPEAILSTDTGPANTLIDAFVQHYYQIPFDENGTIAFSGSVIPALLEGLLQHPFLQQPFPKTTGPEMFSKQWVQQVLEQTNNIHQAPKHIIRTLVAFSAITIANALEHVAKQNQYELFVSGGGWFNPCLMLELGMLLPHVTIAGSNVLGMPPSAKEAVLFALLANETIGGSTLHLGNPLHLIPATTLGKISFPM